LVRYPQTLPVDKDETNARFLIAASAKVTADETKHDPQDNLSSLLHCTSSCPPHKIIPRLMTLLMFSSLLCRQSYSCLVYGTTTLPSIMGFYGFLNPPNRP
jgi:hypothetical protein